MDDGPRIDQEVEALAVWTTQAMQTAAFSARPPRVRIEWQRHGLAAVHDRLEDLKDQSASMGAWQEHAMRQLGVARSLLVEVQGHHDDVVGTGIEAQVSTMAARGMVADERRISHDTRAMPWTLRRRRIERSIPMLDSIERAFRQRLYELRDERMDLRAQLRAIDLGVEIGEL